MSNAYLDPQLGRVLRLKESGADDRHFDYCLEPYTPRRPTSGKYRSENLLWHALQVSGLDALARPAIEALTESLGDDMTVWGAKWDGQRMWFELYFYDPQKEDAAATLTRLRETLAPWLQIQPRIDESVPYMMVSFDLDRAALESKRVGLVNLYLTGESGHAGRSYEVRADDAELTNTYRFLRAKPDSDAILALVKASLYVDFRDPTVLAKVIPPQLFACKKICVAKKRRADGIYFSGIAIDQLLWFLRTLRYPAPIIELLAKHESRFEHLYFDVGIDYRWDPEKKALVYLKSSYYGTV